MIDDCGRPQAAAGARVNGRAGPDTAGLAAGRRADV